VDPCHPVAPVAPGTISTIAGGVGGPGQATTISVAPCGVTFNGTGLYVPGGGVVRSIDTSDDALTTPVGDGLGDGPRDYGGPSTDAAIDGCGVAVASNGNMVIADAHRNRIEVAAAQTGTFYGQAMKAGYVYTVAGDGGLRFSGNGAPALGAGLGDLLGAVRVDAAGNLVFADTYHNRIRVVAESPGLFYGRRMTTGDIYTVAGGRDGGFAGDTGEATKAELNVPEGVAIDRAGNLLIADTGNNRVRVVASSSGTFYGQPMTRGHIYTVAGNGTEGYAGDGAPAVSAELAQPTAVAVDEQTGNLAISDNGNSRVRLVAGASGTFYGQAMTEGDIYTVAGNGLGYSGDGGPALKALFGTTAVALDGGNIVLSGNPVQLVAENTGEFFGQAMTAGDIYIVAGNGVYGYNGDGIPATQAELSGPADVAVDSAGNLIIPDPFNSRIRVVAASNGTFYGQVMKTGYIYTVAGDGKQGFSGDGGPATSAEITEPNAVSVDSSGNLVVADTGNLRVRVVAASSGRFYGQAMTAGNIYTIAGDGQQGSAGDGGPATSAELDLPGDLTVDGSGNVLIPTAGSRLRVVAGATGTFYGLAMTAGDIYTVAGDGVAGFSGDGGPATQAEVTPASVAVDSAGNLLIADGIRVREVTG
jgi:sugar lactone lactonase YvrE